MSEDNIYNLNDAYCVKMFPELVDRFGESALKRASSFGEYVFHEDYFIKFLIENENNLDVIKRGADYIEYLCRSENTLLQNLAKIGLIDSLISKEFTKISEFLGSQSRQTLGESLEHFDVDHQAWAGIVSGNQP